MKRFVIASCSTLLGISTTLAMIFILAISITFACRAARADGQSQPTQAIESYSTVPIQQGEPATSSEIGEAKKNETGYDQVVVTTVIYKYEHHQGVRKVKPAAPLAPAVPEVIERLKLEE